MRTYTCDVCKIVTSDNPMRDRIILQFEYMGKSYMINIQFAQVNGHDHDICRQCQDDIVTSIFKENIVSDVQDTRLSGEEGPQPEREIGYTQVQASRRSR